MKKTLLLIGVFVISFVTATAQSKNDTILALQHQVENLENTNSKLLKQINSANSNIRKLEGKISSSADSMEVLKQNLILTNNKLQAMSDKLESQIQQLSNKTNEDIASLSTRVSHNTTLYWILSIIAITLIPLIMFVRLKRGLSIVKMDLSDEIKASSKAIRQEIIKLDNQVFWSFDLQKEFNKTDPGESNGIDHSLALKVADEIVRIQKNINSMDPDTKGLKQLEFAVDRIQDNFKENGYEMVDLLHKKYDSEMKLSAKFRQDGSLKSGEKIITRIIKPQINYNNITIQEAEVEVSIGE